MSPSVEPTVRTRAVPLTGAAARFAAAAVIAVLFMGSTLLTPLYGLYQTQFGFSGLVLVLLYAVYVVGNAAALLVFGRLSDRIGRRRVVLASLALAALSSMIFGLAGRLGWLFLARVVSGLAVGAGAGAATAWLTEFTPEADRPRASVAATTANFIGVALGPLVAGPFAQYGTDPLRSPFGLYLAAVAIVAAAVSATAETVDPRPLDRSTLRPRLGVPPEIRLAFVAPAVTIFATMAMVGFYAALGPTVIRQDLHVGNIAVSSAIVAELFAVAAVAIPVSARLAARSAMFAGLVLMPPGVALLEVAQRIGSMTALLAGTAVCGAGAALGYRGSLQLVNKMAPPQQRAEVVSSYLLAGFCGNALPVIGVGVLTVLTSARTADLAFAGVVASLAIGAIGMGLRYSGGSRAR